MSNWANSTEYRNQLTQGRHFGKMVNPGQIQQIMRPTQDMINQQVGIGNHLMDPNSDINMQMRGLMEQRAAEAGQQQMSAMTQLQQSLGQQYSNAYLQRIAQNRLVKKKKKKWWQKTGLGRILTGRFCKKDPETTYNYQAGAGSGAPE